MFYGAGCRDEGKHFKQASFYMVSPNVLYRANTSFSRNMPRLSANNYTLD